MTADAASLHCPNCGAPAAPADQSCKYCHAALATVSCPKCFALMFEGGVYCPSCGARRARTAGTDRRAPCPGCAGVMREVVIGTTALMECGGCRATWIDSATFQQICADHETQVAVMQQYAASPAKAPAGEVKYRRCVACGTVMNRLNFGRLSGTIVDVCRHGTFLDAGELHAIVAFIQSGGLDRARQLKIDELKEKEEHLRAMQMRDGGAVQMRFDSTTTWSGLDLLKLLEKLRG